MCSVHYSEDYRNRKKDTIRAYQLDYFRKYPEKKRAKNSKRRALHYKAQGYHTDQELLQLREQQTQCQSCSCVFSKEQPATLDHKTPLCRGGSNSIENLHLLCGSCNYSKREKTWDEYLKWKADKSCPTSSLSKRGGTTE